VKCAQDDTPPLGGPSIPVRIQGFGQVARNRAATARASASGLSAAGAAGPRTSSSGHHQETGMSEEHESFIKTPKQLITVVVLAFVVPILIIVLLVKFVTSDARDGAGSTGASAESVESRIQPVARFELKDASGPKVLRAGADVYKAQCAACHESGAAGAPKFGDAGAWAARIKTGYDALLNSALKGKGAMAPQGGGEFDDTEIGRAVVHMANAAGGKFDEPKGAAPAPAAPAPAAGAVPATGVPAKPAAKPTQAPAPAVNSAEKPVPATQGRPAS